MYRVEWKTVYDLENQDQNNTFPASNATSADIVGIRCHGRTPNVAPTLAPDRRQHSLPLNSAART